MKKLFRKIEESLADAALLEMGVAVAHAPREVKQTFRESLEDRLVEIAYAEAGDYDDIRRAILRENVKADDQVHDDECQYGDNDVCFVH
ncbi:MAG: hypothetical protein A2010_12125 [Nitrospirae bacterium GWD2_57_9]|nr:MAG: hypothetical protein A2010_12125 [Nitrospirae bacterium GWD2_57_9]OGW51301.1 MAG: hypothetical protein A2078_09405 [Nitrospirae bacterium GWC2_57_9]